MLIWYNKMGSDSHPWMIKKGGKLYIASGFAAKDAVVTSLFDADGFRDLPEGPRGILEIHGAVELSDVRPA